MSSLREIKNRIASVNSTRKITSAMKMVASSKLHHAQVRIENMLPYENMMENILKTLILSDIDAKNIFPIAKEVKHVAIIVFSSNSSLCGGFNNNVINKLQRTVNDYSNKGIDVTVYPIGRKVAEKVRKMGFKSAGNFNVLADKPNAKECSDIGQEVYKSFLSGEYNRVELIYHHFKSVGSQILTTKNLLPIDIEHAMDYDHFRDLKNLVANEKTVNYLKEHSHDEQIENKKGKEMNPNFIIEPDIKSLLITLIPQYINLMIYTALLDSNASEHAARMVSMQTATDNADELISQLNLQYNKSRQQSITNELLDIVGGSVNN
jgi:F-type H+-transporting ATPase subunit gamma